MKSTKNTLKQAISVILFLTTAMSSVFVIGTNAQTLDKTPDSNEYEYVCKDIQTGEESYYNLCDVQNESAAMLSEDRPYHVSVPGYCPQNMVNSFREA